VARLNAVGIVVSDMDRSLAFYRLLGVAVPDAADDSGHVGVDLANGSRLMLDTEVVIRSFRPEWERARGNQAALGFECDSPADVDALYARAVEAGFHGEKEPWDAFWGQRYAQLADPDGVPVDLCAAL
jgi:uncharacterized glyoxalase superfamily protein PhnB